MIEPLNWEIRCLKEDEDLKLLIVSLLHSFPRSEAESLCRAIHFEIMSSCAFGSAFEVRQKTLIVVLKTDIRDKASEPPINVIAHEICHILEGHPYERGPLRRASWAEEEANECKNRILVRYHKEMERLKAETDISSIRELFAQVYPEEFA